MTEFNIIQFFRTTFAEMLCEYAPDLKAALTNPEKSLNSLRAAYDHAFSISSWAAADSVGTINPSATVKLYSTLDYCTYALVCLSRTTLAMVMKRFMLLDDIEPSHMTPDGRPLWDILANELGFSLESGETGSIEVWVAHDDGKAMDWVGTF